MRTLISLAALLFFSSLAFGADCPGWNGQIMRGDADCSDSYDSTDVIAILQGTYTNADAADVNDDGVINTTDAIVLNDWLFNGNPTPPAPPYNQRGYDCTPDDFENCHSPKRWVGSTWGFSYQSHDNLLCQGTSFPRFPPALVVESGTGTNHGVVQLNDNACPTAFSNGQTRCSMVTLFFGDANEDVTYFTRSRLEKGVQMINLDVEFEIDFQSYDAAEKALGMPNPCQDCPAEADAVSLGVDLEPAGGGDLLVDLQVDNVTSGGFTSLSLAVPINTVSLREALYHRTLTQQSECVPELLGGAWSHLVVVSDEIASQVATEMASKVPFWSSCDEIKITGIWVGPVKCEFIVWQKDGFFEDRIDLEVSPWITYEYCQP